MKKLLLSVFAIGLVSLVAFGATRAYFSDQEQILGNSIQTGTLKIELNDFGRSPYQFSMNFPISNLQPGVSTRWISPNGLEKIHGLEISSTGSIVPNHYEAKFTFSNFHDGFDSGMGLNSSKNDYLKSIEVINLYSQKVPGYDYTSLLNQINDPADSRIGFRSLYDLANSVIDNIPVGDTSSTLRFEFKMDENAGNMFQGDSIDLNLYIGAAQNAGQSVL